MAGSDHIGARVKEARTAAGLSQQALAEQVGVSQAAINKLESTPGASSRKLVEIAKVLGVAADWLATGSSANRPKVSAPDRVAPALPQKQQLELYQRMVLVREAELAAAEVFAAGEIPGFIHLSVGQEGFAAGITSPLRPDDTIAATHRGHGIALCKGVALERFFLELLGRAEGLCAGRGGSMHVADLAIGMLGANGIVGGGLSLAAGSAMAHQVRGSDAVAVACFGDGAQGEGLLHETLNLAALWQLPLLFACENNGWGEFSPVERQFAARIGEVATAFGIESVCVCGEDVAAVAAMTGELVAAIRAGEGPKLIECHTHRARGHFEGDPQRYRSEDDQQAWLEKDPIAYSEQQLATAGVAQGQFDDIRVDAKARVTAAVEQARRGALPTFASARAGVYAPAGA